MGVFSFFECTVFLPPFMRSLSDLCAVARQLVDTPIVVYLWRDLSKTVCVVDTTTDPTQVDSCSRKQDTQLPVPAAIKSYQAHLSRVDRADQFTSYYHFQHRSLRYYIPIFFHLFETILSNCTILYNSLHPEHNVSHRVFREDLAHELLHQHAPLRKRSGRQVSVAGSVDRFTGRHFPATSDHQRACVVGCGKRPVTICPVCHVNLCCVPCFGLYHTAPRH